MKKVLGKGKCAEAKKLKLSLSLCSRILNSNVKHGLRRKAKTGKLDQKECTLGKTRGRRKGWCKKLSCVVLSINKAKSLTLGNIDQKGSCGTSPLSRGVVS